MKNKKTISSGLSILAALSIFVPLTGCDFNGSSVTNEKVDYEITVKNLIDVAFENVTVSLKSNGSVIATADTDKDGKVLLNADKGVYDISIDNADLPLGYYCYDGTYKTDETTTSYTVNCLSEVIYDDVPADKVYKVGDIIHDVSFTNTEGKFISLLNVLQEKEVALINIWATWCGPCEAEFPYLEEAYKEYSDRVAVLAISYSDNNAGIRSYKQNHELTFDMGHEDELVNHVNTTGIPTSLVVDRYGMITMIHVGAITKKDTFVDIFEKHTGDDYKPSVSLNNGDNNDNDGEDDDQDQVIQLPTYTMPSSEEIGAVVNGDGFNTTYTSEANDEYAWPFIISEDGKSIEPSNGGYHGSYSILNFEITLEENQVFAFDYKTSSEQDADILYVVIEGDIIYQLSGYMKDFDTCFAFVAVKQGKYPVSFIYQKDGSLESGDDTVYVNNFRYLTIEDIDKPTYIKRSCVWDKTILTNKYKEYITPVMNTKDGYYRMGDENGPLILLDFFYGTYWDYSASFYETVISHDTLSASKNRLIIDEYASYGSNNKLRLTPVTETLKAAVHSCLTTITGTNYQEQWLELCYYYDAYGTNGKQLESPIVGLALFDPLYAQEGDQNFVEYDTPILPRGKYAKFVPTRSGAYRIKSMIEDTLTVCWLFDENRVILYESNDYLRSSAINYNPNADLYVYMEKDVTYFINMAYGDYLQFGTIQYSVEYLGETAERLEKCSSPLFTTPLDENGEMDMDNIISIGIDYKLGDDGYYHELKPNGELGSIIYADFKYSTAIFTETLVQVVTKGGFVIDQDEQEKSNGFDLTVEFASYIKNQIVGGELDGLVPVDVRLAELLQILMDYHTFNGVDDSWLKLCYYYRAYEALN